MDGLPRDLDKLRDDPTANAASVSLANSLRTMGQGFLENHDLKRDSMRSENKFFKDSLTGVTQSK